MGRVYIAGYITLSGDQQREAPRALEDLSARQGAAAAAGFSTFGSRFVSLPMERWQSSH